MVTRLKWLICLIIAVLAVGCNFHGGRPTRTQEVSPTVTIPQIRPSATPGAPQQPSPTQPNIMATPSSTYAPVITVTPTSTAMEIPVCPAQGQLISQPADFGIPGALAYQQSMYFGLFTIGGQPLQQGVINAEQSVVVYGFSPDGRWLAYAPEIPRAEDKIEFGTPKMVLLSATRTRIEQVINVNGLEEELQARCCCCQGDEFFDSAGEWINDRLIYLRLGATAELDGGMVSTLPKVFDPFTGNWQDQWFNSLPDLYTITIAYVGLESIKLSPDLTRVLYPAQSGGLILRDVTQAEMIRTWSRLDFPAPWGEYIEWSPDSAYVVAANFGMELRDRRVWLIERDGDVTDLLKGSGSVGEVLVGGFSWSPDSRYLIFADEVADGNLYLYDVLTRQYVYQCPLPGSTQGMLEFFWSPDQQWIAYSDLPDGSLHLLNVQTGEVIRLLDGAYPVGWSETFPVEWP